MRVAPPVLLDNSQQQTLEQWARSRSLPARQVERAKVVLLAAEARSDLEISAALRISNQKAARWRKRFLQSGLAGLEKDAPRPGRKPAISASVKEELVHKTTQSKPENATHWSTRTMAAEMGVSEATVRRVWHAHGLKPHLMETFKVSKDKHFAENLQAIVGLYLNPPEHAIVKCVDVKSQIQALDRSQPGSQNWLRRGVFRDVEEVIMATGGYIDRHNGNFKPFIWTAKATDTLEKVKRARRSLNNAQSV